MRTRPTDFIIILNHNDGGPGRVHPKIGVKTNSNEKMAHDRAHELPCALIVARASKYSNNSPTGMGHARAISICLKFKASPEEST